MISDRKLARQYDGATMGNPHHPGVKYQVFVPAWWQVWRWVAYWRAESRGRVAIVANARAIELRCITVKVRSRLQPRRL